MYTRYSRWSKSLHWLCLWSYHRRLCCSWMWIFMLGCVIQKTMAFLNNKKNFFFQKSCHDGCILFVCVYDYVLHFWNPKLKASSLVSKGATFKIIIKKTVIFRRGGPINCLDNILVNSVCKSYIKSSFQTYVISDILKIVSLPYIFCTKMKM